MPPAIALAFTVGAAVTNVSEPNGVPLGGVSSLQIRIPLDSSLPGVTLEIGGLERHADLSAHCVPLESAPSIP